MPTVGARELKNRLGTYLRQVREGQTLVVTDRGRAFAEIRPLPVSTGSDEESLNRLAAQGLITPPTRPRAPRVRPARIPGRSVADLILEEREDRF